ncbi:uncharacterized protein SOCG_00649 [Schizosaccharomyces octosporus yFS286]|uniref:Uncharacterized protein n=1 Tax=Schizosaccharomyces octosporus (strain yFS286) TaxID=483514 RepID=S9PY43_SCHOY|nr:uncharacterized protein SOCG_00649 [Schizosaccharomyces octosporus yFS286]EPX72887.1 hypothetical protein SOCG_00649 [Schizosaccharomyces octosporus yFS286]
MNQDLFANPFGIPPPGDDSYASLRRYTNQFEEAIPKDQFALFEQRLANLLKALASKFQGESLSQDHMFELKQTLETLSERVHKLEQGQNSLREELMQTQNSLIERLEGQSDLISRIQKNYFKTTNGSTKDTEAIALYDGIDFSLSCMN